MLEEKKQVSNDGRGLGGAFAGGGMLGGVGFVYGGEYVGVERVSFAAGCMLGWSRFRLPCVGQL